MAVAKRTGPDFLFLANAHSQKFDDLEQNKEACIIFHNSTNQDWISVSGTATTTKNDDPRIKEIYSKPVSAWFGDLKDGVHDGSPNDPRMKLIEIKAKCKSLQNVACSSDADKAFADISYWKHDVSMLGYAKEVGQATFTGGVANTGTLREMKSDDIEQARKRDSALSS